MSAAQLVGHGTPGAKRDAGLGNPMTAWDVIDRASRAAAPAAPAAVATFGALDFAAHAHESRDCIAYLRMTMATYSWKRVVASSATDFGVLGPRDLNLGVSGEAKYYEVLAESLSPVLANVLANALRLGLVRNAFVPDRGASNYISLHILGADRQGQQGIAAKWIVGQLDFRVGPTATKLLEGGVDFSDQVVVGGFPPPNQGNTIFTILGEVTPDQIDGAFVEGWSDKSNDALRQLARILRVLADASESPLIESGAEGILCRRADGTGEFDGPLKHSAAFADVTGIQLNIEFRARRSQKQLLAVASGDVEPESVWFWACNGALDASLCATCMLEALNDALDADRASQPLRELAFQNLYTDLMRRYVSRLQTTSPRHAVSPADAAAQFLGAMQGPAPVPDDEANEANARRQVVAYLASSPVVSGVFAESDRTIVMPCHPDPAKMSIAATQLRQEPSDDLDYTALSEAFCARGVGRRRPPARSVAGAAAGAGRLPPRPRRHGPERVGSLPDLLGPYDRRPDGASRRATAAARATSAAAQLATVRVSRQTPTELPARSCTGCPADADA